jgi:hypothetical protein
VEQAEGGVAREHANQAGHDDQPEIVLHEDAIDDIQHGGR